MDTKQFALRFRTLEGGAGAGLDVYDPEQDLWLGRIESHPDHDDILATSFLTGNHYEEVSTFYGLESCLDWLVFGQ